MSERKKRLERVKEDIKKTRKKIKETQEHLKVLLALQRQLENDEIVAVLRAETEKGGDVMETLKKLEALKRAQEDDFKDEDLGKDIEIDE